MTVYLLVFLSTLLADVAWTRYTLAVTERRALLAAIWSAAIVLFGAFNIVTYVHDSWAIVPAAIGAFAGTWWAVGHGKK